MREIKFRAWDKKKKFMHEPRTYIFNGMWLDERKSATCDLVVMQYTGLKDKNGKEIYEGDIYQVSDTGYRTVVRMEKTYWTPLLVFEGEVIGNIYENPELIKKQSMRGR